MTQSVLFRGVAAPLASFAVGASRIAGPPDLPAAIAWPRGADGRALPMVLQLALADVAAHDVPLPKTGIMYFFAAQLAESTNLADQVPAAVIYTPVAELVRATRPPEADDDTYWDRFEVARIAEFRAHTSATEEDEPADDDLHVLFPTTKLSSAFGTTPPEGFVGLLEMRSDYAIGMNWGDAAWATWVVSEADLAAHRFDRATAHVWIG